MATQRIRRANLVLCNHPGCRRTTAGRYCSDHAYKPPPRERDPFLDSRPWRAMSKAKLMETPWCEHCLKNSGAYISAMDVDHVKPRHTYPQLALVYANLQSLCGACHLAKTRVGL